MFFGMVSDFKNQIANLPDIHLLVIRMEHVPFIDQSGLYALETALEELHQQDVVVVLSGTNSTNLNALRRMKIIPQVLSERHVFDNFDSCIAWLRNIVMNENDLQTELRMLNKPE